MEEITEAEIFEVLKKLQKFRPHEQTKIEIGDLIIECDRRISHIIEYINKIDYVNTTDSCWNNFNEGRGYVDILDLEGEFISYLDGKLEKNINYHIKEWPKQKKGKKIQVIICPKYKVLDSISKNNNNRLIAQWMDFFEIVKQYKPQRF